MYKIKYVKNRFAVLLNTLIFALFFAAGAVTVLVAERVNTVRAAEGSAEVVSAEDEPISADIPEDIPLPSPEVSVLREVQIEGIELPNYISEGDTIDVRVVNRDGCDEKLLAEKRITGLDRTGFLLLVAEDELGIITKARIEMEEGGIIRAYAVRIP